MTKEESISKIKETLKRLMSFSDTKKFEDVETADGTKLQVEGGTDLAVGVAIYKLDDQGTQTPCEDGTYELKDGRTIVVKGGLIDSLSDSSENPKEDATDSPTEDASTAPTAASKMAAPAAATPATETPADAGADGDVVSRIDALEQQIAQILEILQGMANMNEQTMSKVNEFAASPAEESIRTKKVEANVWEKSKATYNKNKNEIDELKTIMKKNTNSAYGSFKVNQ
jgi:hypothetical protein